MKIANQLLSTTPSAGIKTGPSLEQKADFHSALTVATATAAGASSKDTPEMKAKLRAPASESQTTEIKKKGVVSNSTADDVSTKEVAALQQPLLNVANHLVTPLPPSNDLNTTASDRTLSLSNSGAELTGGEGSFSSSLASISPAVQSASNLSTIGSSEQQAADSKPTTHISSDDASELPAPNAIDQVVSEAVPVITSLTATQIPVTQEDGNIASVATTPVATTKVAPPASAALVAPLVVAAARTASALPTAIPAVVQTSPVPTPSVSAAPVSPAVSASHFVTSKVAAIDQAANVSKAVDTSNANLDVPVVDLTPLAVEQAAAATAQSVAVPVSIPGVSAAGQSQAALAIGANQTFIAGNAANSVEGAASRQTTSGAKAKTGSATSANGSRFDDSSSINTPTEPTSATIASLMSKSGAPGTGNQGVNGPHSAFDPASLQQGTQAGPTDSGNQTPQVAPNVSASAGITAQTPQAHTALDSQAMQSLSSAQLVQSMHSSEMKLGMQSAEFGNISISTSLNRQALSAQISIDHSELGRALAVHLPEITEKLGSAYGVQAKIELRDSSNPSSDDSGYSNSGQQSREQRHSEAGGSTASPGATFERIAVRTGFAPLSTTVTASRLDIRI